MTGYSTNDRSNYRRHTKTHIAVTATCTSTPHKDEADQDVPASTCICEHCGKEFKSKFGLRLHVKNKHEMTFKHTCNMCGKGFNQTVQYKFHCSQHLQFSLNKCSGCKVEFFSPGSLQRHRKSCTSICGAKD